MEWVIANDGFMNVPSYDCSQRSSENWTLEYGKESTVHGWLSLTYGIIIEFLYIPCLIVIGAKKNFCHSCFKLMFALGVVNMISVAINSIINGAFLLKGVVYCSCPEFIYFIGSLSILLWTTSCFLCVALVLNRLFDISRISLHTYHMIFRGDRTHGIVFLAFAYGAFFFFFSRPTVFNSKIGAWLFDPLITEPRSPQYDNIFFTLNNMLFIGIIIILYAFFIVTVGRQMKENFNATDNNRRIHNQIFIQSSLISSVVFISCILYIIEQFFKESPYLTIVAQIGWQLSHGVPAIIYIIMNKTIRKGVRHIFLPHHHHSISSKLMSEQFWIDLSHFISQARNEQTNHFLQLWVENITAPIHSSATENESEDFSDVLTTYCTSVKIEKMKVDSDQTTIPVNDDVLRKILLKDIDCQYSNSNDTFLLKINVDESHIFEENQMFGLFKYMISQSRYKNCIVQSIRKLVLPNILFGSIELTMSYNDSNNSLNIYLCNHNGLVLSKMEEICFLNSSTNQSSIQAYIRKLGYNCDDLEESFTQIGLDSLEISQFNIHLMEKYQCDYGITEIFPTISQLSEYLKASKKSSTKEHEKGTTLYELSPQQIQLVVMNEMYSSERQQFSEIFSLTLNKSKYNPSIIHKSLMRVIMNQKVFRTLYEPSNTVPFTILSGTECFLSQHHRKSLYDHLTINITEEISVKFSILEEASQSWKLFFNFHHIAVDALSISAIMKHLFFNAQLPTKQYFECSFQTKETDNAYWRQNLTATEKLPTEMPRRAVHSSMGKRLEFRLPSHFTDVLRKLRKTTNCSDFSILTSIHLLLTSKTSFLNQFTVGISVSTRKADTSDVIGCFVNTLPLTVNIEPDETISNFIRKVDKLIRSMQNHSSVPFRDLVKQSSPESIFDAMSLFQVLLVQDFVEMPVEGILETNCSHTVMAKYEQTWYFQKSFDLYKIIIEYQTDIFSDSFIRKIGQKFSFLLNALTYQLNSQLSEISISSIEEQCLIENEEHENKIDFPYSTIFEYFFQNQQSSSSYFEFCNEKTFYNEIKTSICQISNMFIQQYISFYGEFTSIDRQIVLICKRNSLLPSYVLAAWMAGFSLLPISYDWPTERIVRSVSQFPNSLVITDDEELQKRLSVEAFCVFKNRQLGYRRRSFNRICSDDLAYLTFTSGSTGEPKAVCTSFRGHSNLASEYTRILNINSRTVVYQVVNYAFDIFFADFSKILSNGCSCVLAKDRIPFDDELSKCSNAYIMPAYLSSMMDTSCLKDYESLHFGGEPIQPNALDNLLDLNIPIVQEYGLTEQTVFTSYKRLKRNSRVSELGIPYHNLSVQLRDTSFNLLPKSFLGEICLKSMLCRGYFNRTKENLKKFDGGIMKSGDIGQYRKGKIHFLHRFDQRIKINGQIVDLDEIQYFYSKMKSIASCLIIPHRIDDKTTHLISYFIRKDQDICEDDIMEESRKNLAHCMIPKIIYFLDEFPLTSNGKVDKARLPKPSSDKLLREDHAENELDSLLMRLMKKYLKRDKLQKKENFFVNGGDSLKALLIIQDLQKFGFSISLKEFMISENISSASKKIVPLQETVLIKTIETTKSQKRIWFLQQLNKHSDAYIIKLHLKGIKKNQEIVAAFNTIRISNYGLRQDYRNEKGNLVVRRLSGTECFLPFLSSAITMPTLDDIITLSYESENLYLFFHHIAVDGQSIAILIQQLFCIIRKKSFEFQNCFISNQNHINEPYWKEQFKDFEVRPMFPSSASVHNSQRASYLVINLGEYEKKLLKLSENLNCTVYNILVACYASSVREVFLLSDFVSYMTVSNRQRQNMRTIGFFVETLPIRFNKDFSTREEFLSDCKHKVLNLLDNSSDSLMDVLDFLKLSSDDIRCCVTYQATSSEDLLISDVFVDTILPDYSQFDLSFVFYKSKHGLKLRIEYSRDLIPDSSARKIEQKYLKNLEDHLEYDRHQESRAVSPLSLLDTCPETTVDIQTAVLEIFKETLKAREVTEISNFFKVGGNSLLAIKLIYLLEERFSSSIPLKMIFECPTPLQMASFIQNNCHEKQHGDVEQLKSLYISPNQEALLRSFKIKSNIRMYDIHLKVTLKKTYSKIQIIKSLNTVIMSHQSLRLSFQTINEKYEKTLLSGTECFQNPWSESLASNNLFSFVYDKNRNFKLQMSHLISDGYSFAVILKDFQESLDGSVLQTDNSQDFHSWLSQKYKLEKKKNFDYWTEALKKNDNFTAFPSNFYRKATTQRVEIPALHETLKELSKRYGKTSFHVMMSILGNVFKQIHGRPMAIAFPQNLRRKKDENVVDLAINVPIIISDVTGKAHLDIKDTSNKILEAMEHSFISFDDLQTISQKSHLYDFMLMYDNYSKYSNTLMSCEAIEEKYVKCPLTLQVDSFEVDELILVYAHSIISSDYLVNFIRIFKETLSNWKKLQVRHDSYDLSYQQKQMLFLSKTKQKNSFALSFILKLPSASDTHHIHKRLMQIIQINQQFRTIFSHSKSSIYQTQLSATEVFLCHQTIKTRNIKFFIENFQNSETVTPRNPVCCLFLEFDEVIYAYLVLHHIISDGWTTKLLEKDLICSSLPNHQKLSYIDYITSDKYKIPSEQIPDSQITRILSTENIFGTHKESDENRVQKLVKFQGNSGASPFVVCLRVVSSAIARIYGKSVINVGFPHLNRTKETEDIYGCFLVNHVINLHESYTLREIEEKVVETLKNNYSYMELHKQTKGKVCEIFLNFRYDLEEKQEGLEDLLPIQTQFPLEIDVDKYEDRDLIVLRSSKLGINELQKLIEQIVDEIQKELPDQELQKRVEQAAEEIDDTRVASVLRIAARCLGIERKIRASDSFYELGGNSLNFIQFLDQMEEEFRTELNYEKIRLAHNFQEISELIFPKKEKTTKKEDFPLFTSAQTVLNNFHSYPSRPAFITSDGKSWCYGEVEKAVFSIYKQLNKHFIETTGQGIRNDDIIPIISRNSMEVHLWILAVQLTGASYLPILEDVPVKRINKILSRIPSLSLYLGKENKEIHLKPLTLNHDPHGSFRVFNKNEYYDLSYIIYTSGTTGEPKGVCIQQKSLIHMMNGSTKNFWLNPRDRILQATLFVYDNSILESWMTSCNGGCLALPSIPCTPKQIHLFILKHKITICLLFPAFVSILREETLRLFKHLRYWIVGAEKLPESLLRKALDYDIHTIQNYGPTETTAYALSRLMRRKDNPQNLGKVIQNCKYWIDDDGILFLSGEGLMRGYLNVQKSPFLVQKNYKFYKTGDVVVEQNENIIFVGRKDNQVKIRGHRVELSEIETVLTQHQLINQAKLIWNDKDEILEAFCQTAVSPDDVMMYCKENLPSHMIPTEISCLEQLPLTSNLKIDVEALKGRNKQQSSKPHFLEAVKREGFTSFDVSFLQNGGYTLKALELIEQCQNCPKLEHLLSDIPLKDIYEKRNTRNTETAFDLRAVWSEVLGHQMFKESSDFFEVGGNSVLLMRMANVIQEEFEFIEVDDLLNNLVFHQMTKILRKEKSNERANISLVQNGETTEKTLVFYHPLYGGSHIYKYIINILMRYIKNIQIICVEHPNSFKIQTTEASYFNNLTDLCYNYYKSIKHDLKGEVYLIGASLGGTLAYISSQFIQNSTVIMIDSTSATSQCYSFQQHLSSVRQYVSDPSISSFHYILLNSWDLMKMILNHQHTRIASNKPVYQLSIDGTDLGWKKICCEVKVIQISGNHSTMLNLINSIELFEKLKEILK